VPLVLFAHEHFPSRCTAQKWIYVPLSFHELRLVADDFAEVRIQKSRSLYTASHTSVQSLKPPLDTPGKQSVMRRTRMVGRQMMAELETANSVGSHQCVMELYHVDCI
jgi:hypothetical protein